MYESLAFASLAILGGVGRVAAGADLEFRYCPPTKYSDAQMQACSGDLTAHTSDNLSFQNPIGQVPNNSTSTKCQEIRLENGPVITILSSLLGEDSMDAGALVGLERSQTMSCKANPWTVVVNKSVNTQDILKSWSQYSAENGFDDDFGEKRELVGAPMILSLLCYLPFGSTYKQQCQNVFDLLYLPMSGLEAIFPYQFSMYCFLCLWIGSLIFDVLHWTMHRLHHSKYKALRAIGWLHMTHHYYFNRNLQFNEKYAWHNTWVELPMEGFCLYLGCVVAWYGCGQFGLTNVQGYFTADVFRKIVLIIAIRTGITMYVEGKDSNHPVGWKTVPKDPDFLSVGAEYHCLHHIEPDAYYSSIHRFLDHFIGAAASFKGRRITMTGSSGAYGQALIKLLEKEKVKSITPLTFGKDWTHDDLTNSISHLENTDILILAHGTKGEDAMQANCYSAIKLIEAFREHRKDPVSKSMAQMLPEVWYLGSEIEIIPPPKVPDMLRYSASKRAFAPYGRAYYDEKDILYRHIVPAGFTSSMGKGLVSADWAAAVTMFFIRRGARYVPVTYTAMAYWNYFKFMYFTKPKKAGGESISLTQKRVVETHIIEKLVPVGEEAF